MKTYFSLTLKIVAALIMLQTLFFKFTGAQESIDLFTQLVGKNESIMRFGTGIIELVASVLFFIPKKAWLGALLATGTMSGAILSHITILGIEHNNDNGVLFIGALITLIASVILLFINKKQIPLLGKKLS